MLDKLEMRTEQIIDPRILRALLPGHQITTVPDTWYRLSTIVKAGKEHILTLKTDPFNSTAAPAKIIMNPSRWGSLESMATALAPLCDLTQLEITRIDHAVDLPVPIGQVHAGIRVKYKQDYDWYRERGSKKRGQLTGFYFGNKPELYSIYDKGFQLRGKSLKRDKSQPEGVVTRIELRQWGKKVRHKSLGELFNYLEEEPFKHVEYWKPRSDLALETRHQIESILTSEGCFNAYFKLNRNKNFKRDAHKALELVDLAGVLTKVYREKLRQFLGADSQGELK